VNPLFNYVVSVDLIEQKTGIDFFPALEDSIEDGRAISLGY
jgi:endonuclease G